MPELRIRRQVPEDDGWVAHLWNSIDDHLPPLSVATFRYWMKLDEMAEQALVERYVGWLGDRRVGAVSLEKMWWTGNQNRFRVSVMVEPELWGRGCGEELYHHLLMRMDALGGDRMYGNVRADCGHAQAFVERRACVKTGHGDRWSRLEVRNANLEGYEGVEERLSAEGIRIFTLAQVGESEPFLRRLWRLNDEALRDIPMTELMVEDTPFEMFLAEIHEPEMAPERLWVALRGDEPVGLVMLAVRGERAAFNAFTGTARAHRGKGVARALKLKAIEWASEHTLDYIYTANDPRNTRMLSINNSLGYQVLPVSEEVVKAL